MKEHKKAGALLAISSLPSNYGVGDFGHSAYQFIDILVSMKMKIWQVLPLNPLGFGNSPYQSYSSFAGDPLYISIDRLVADGLLSHEDAFTFNSNAIAVNYTVVRKHKQPMLKKAFLRFREHTAFKTEYKEFVESMPWLHNFAVFLTLKQVNHSATWTLWSEEHKNWIKNKNIDLSSHQEQIEYEMFLQFIFYHQWSQLKDYARKHDIAIMGDIPIYTGFDSLDVWENQGMYLLDETQKPQYVAGVPPDFFSATGQLWGNPLYNWEALKANQFKFWIERLRGNSRLFDIIRIDHFRAFDTYWKIPGDATTAIEGEWVEAPGYELFDRIYQELPEIKIIAEDLGDLRPEVLKLRDHYNLKGMKVFQFHFTPEGDNQEFDKNSNCIIYSGTHDNSTLIGWFNALSVEHKQKILTYFNATPETVKNAILKYCLNSDAEYVIFPVQDIIGLDESARFNTPGQIGSPNWEWKLADFAQLKAEIPFIAQAITDSKRG